MIVALPLAAIAVVDPVVPDIIADTTKVPESASVASVSFANTPCPAETNKVAFSETAPVSVVSVGASFILAINVVSALAPNESVTLKVKVSPTPVP